MTRCFWANYVLSDTMSSGGLTRQLGAITEYREELAPKMRRMSTRDLLQMKTVHDVAMAPCGSRLAWVETRMDQEKDCYRSRIMWSQWDDGVEVPLTRGEYRDTSPQWSPDGNLLAFLSDRPLGATKNETRQVWVIRTSGGEAWPVTDLKYGVRHFSWAPDSRNLCIAAPIPPGGPEYLDDPDEDEKDFYRKYNRDTRVITRIRYKWDGLGFLDEKRTHLGVVSVQPEPSEISRPKFLTSGEYDVQMPRWSPDGRHIAFVSNLDPESDFQRHVDIYLIDATGGEAKKITPSKGPITALSFDPEGKYIAYIGHSRPQGGYSNPRLWVTGIDGGEPLCLTSDCECAAGDRSASDFRGTGSLDPAWSQDSRHVTFPGSLHGRVHLFQAALSGDNPRVVVDGDRAVTGFSMLPGGKAAFIAVDSLSPGRVYAADLGQTETAEHVISDPNRDFLAEIDLAVPERLTFHVDGIPHDGWIMRPPGLEPEDQCPAVLQIHGGPMGMYGDCFHHEFQCLAAAGFAVFYSNPRGSLGYGEEFCAAIRGDWGNLDYHDLMSFADHVLDNYGFIDPDRLGVAGGSYGGFMTNWIVTHTNRFGAGVTMRSLVNFHSFFGSSDAGYHFVDDVWGEPWEATMKYIESSPIYHVAACKTPLMIIHSDMDMRCPIDGADQLFVSLRKLGVDTEFVRFSGESHGLSRGGKPWHRVFRLDKIIEWFEKYLVARDDSQ